MGINVKHLKVVPVEALTHGFPALSALQQDNLINATKETYDISCASTRFVVGVLSPTLIHDGYYLWFRLIEFDGKLGTLKKFIPLGKQLLDYIGTSYAEIDKRYPVTVKFATFLGFSLHTTGNVYDTYKREVK